VQPTYDINTLYKSHEEVAADTKTLIDERKANKVAGLRTYLGTLDNKMDPVMPGDLLVGYGISGHGKTTVAMQWLDKHERSMREMGDKEINVYVTSETLIEAAMTYLMSIDTGIDRRLIKRGELTDEQYERVVGTKGYVAQFANRNIFFIGDSYFAGRDQPPLSPRYIQDACHAIEDMSGRKVRTVFIDWLGQLDMKGYEGDSHTLTYLNVMKAIKSMSKVEKWQTVLLAQAKQEIEGRDDPVPTDKDVEHSNSPRQIADFMVGFMRPWKYKDIKSCLASGKDYHGIPVGYVNGKYVEKVHLQTQLFRLNKQKDGDAPVDHFYWMDPATARVVHPDPYAEVDLNGSTR
jgi:replicative DNA helicase